MRRLRSIVLLSIAVAAAAGCSRAISEFRDDLRREKQQQGNAGQAGDGACGKGGQGRVNVSIWQQRVQDFQARQFKGKQGFQSAKQNLLSDLANERERACTWEFPAVDDLIAQARSAKY
jgi:hypothetical protein